jgi:hypothetical protein
MRRLTGLVLAALGLSAALPSTTFANLALFTGQPISAFSAQLLKKPRSYAGNYKNVWDADIDALEGMHYFVYNVDENMAPLPKNQRVITALGGDPGPGYNVTWDILIREGSTTSFVNANDSQDPNGHATFGWGAYDEVGIVRISFTQNGSARGQIEPSADLDGSEMMYSNALGVRGVEQARFETEYLSHSPVDANDITGIPGFDDLIARGYMTAIIPSTFAAAGLAPVGGFEDGYLKFADPDTGQPVTFTGSQILPALAATPEPSSIGMLGLAAGALLRRSRRRR